jgi:hypothetical protein
MDSLDAVEKVLAAAGDALQGLERISIPAENLLWALAGGGTPSSLEAFRQRFSQYLATRTAGHEPSRVRISLDW